MRNLKVMEDVDNFVFNVTDVDWVNVAKEQSIEVVIGMPLNLLIDSVAMCNAMEDDLWKHCEENGGICKRSNLKNRKFTLVL